MSDAEEFKFSLKVMINIQKRKVLYAEADSGFTDVLLSFLTLPLGTIVRLLNEQYGDEAPTIGGLTTLYNSLSNLDSGEFFCTESGKQMLLVPRNSSEALCRKLKINIDDTPPTTYYECVCMGYSYFDKHPNIGIYYDTMKCLCGKQLNRAMDTVKGPKTDDSDGGVFTKTNLYFIVTDDLRVLPNVTRNALQILSSFGITDTSHETELRILTFGFNEIMDLLKGSLVSRTPLTDLVLNERQMDRVTVKCETGTLLGDHVEKLTNSNTMKMTVVAILKNSTNKLLFAEADDDFVDFLFSLLTIPLGGVERLLGGSTSGLKNIENLYRSIANINGEKYMKADGKKIMLLEPKLPFGYISENQILPLTEEKPWVCEYYSSVTASHVKSPKGPGNYVKGPRTFMVTDDLTVTPMCTTSGVSILNSLNIPLSDVKELELDVGVEEALSILKASLTSTSVLTDGLLNPIIKEQPGSPSAVVFD